MAPLQFLTLISVVPYQSDISLPTISLSQQIAIA
jgi:hypothetical protein